MLTAQTGQPEADQCYDDPQSLPKDAEGNPSNGPCIWSGAVFACPRKRNGSTCVDRHAHGVRLWQRREACYALWMVPGQFGEWSHAVGQLRPNLRGLFDVHGNLYEWCHDWYGEDLSDDAEDPMGAEAGSFRVFRGGSWGDPASDCRSAYRNWPAGRPQRHPGLPRGHSSASQPSQSSERSRER